MPYEAEGNALEARGIHWRSETKKKGEEEEEENRASISDVIGKRETTNNITHTVGRPECSVVILWPTSPTTINPSPSFPLFYQSRYYTWSSPFPLPPLYIDSISIIVLYCLNVSTEKKKLVAETKNPPVSGCDSESIPVSHASVPITRQKRQHCITRISSMGSFFIEDASTGQVLWRARNKRSWMRTKSNKKRKLLCRMAIKISLSSTHNDRKETWEFARSVVSIRDRSFSLNSRQSVLEKSPLLLTDQV